eukprot:16615-Heterococcus_DN1.PRE.5
MATICTPAVSRYMLQKQQCCNNQNDSHSISTSSSTACDYTRSSATSAMQPVELLFHCCSSGSSVRRSSSAAVTLVLAAVTYSDASAPLHSSYLLRCKCTASQQLLTPMQVHRFTAILLGFAARCTPLAKLVRACTCSITRNKQRCKVLTAAVRLETQAQLERSDELYTNEC